MKNLKEILRCKIEEALDYGFDNHIPLTSDYLAEKLLAKIDTTNGELQQIERYQAAITFMQKAEKEQDAVIEFAVDMLLDPIKHLTPDELQRAYLLQQHEYDKSDIENELELAREDYVEKYKIDEFPVTDDEIDRMAFVLRQLLDRDADACWSHTRAEAVCEVLRRRKRRYIIDSPTDSISINGLEYMLDDNGDEIVFDSIDYAKCFLSSLGIGEKEIEAQGIQFKEVIKA